MTNHRFPISPRHFPRLWSQNLLARFALVSFLVCAFIALAFGWMLQQRLVGNALSQQAQEGGAVVDAILWSYLTPLEMKHPAAGSEYRRLSGLVQNIKRSEGHIVRIKVWNPKGMIFFSDDPRIVGRNFGIDSGLRQALGGHTSSSITDLNDPENVDERRFGPQLLQTYVPIKGKAASGANTVIGAYEIYHDMKALNPQIASITRFVVFSVGGGFLVLFLSLFALVRGASKRLNLQAHDNDAKAARLETINELTRSINAKNDLDSICSSALNGLGGITIHRPILVVVRADGQVPSIHSEGLTEVRPEVAECLLSRIPDVPSVQNFSNDASGAVSLEDCGFEATDVFYSVPILLRSQLIGLLGVGLGSSTNEPRDLSANETEALLDLSLQLAAAVDNAQLLQQAAEVAALREMDKLKDEFISVVSHELRRPLSSIKGYAATLLLHESWDESTRRDLLQVIDEESDRLTSLIENLLDLSRLGTGMLTLNLEPILLPRLAEEVCKRIETHPELAPHTYKVDFPDHFPTVEADANRVTQVLLNLVENSAKYSPPNTIVHVQGRYIEDDGIVEVTVEDEGIGVRDEDIERIFERFYRVDNSLARRTQGTGLGLSIARGVVQAHGGSMRAEVRQRGLAVIFNLPGPSSEAPHVQRIMAGAIGEAS